MERAFWVIQAHLAIYGLAWYLDKGNLGLIMKACVILHNMIVKNECDSYDLTYGHEYVDGTTPEPNVLRNHHLYYAAYLCRVAQVQNSKQHARF